MISILRTEGSGIKPGTVHSGLSARRDLAGLRDVGWTARISSDGVEIGVR
jgi:hypothetical protein